MRFKSNHIIKIIFFSIICYNSASCNKENAKPINKLPANYEEMFAALNLQFNVTYTYTEKINNSETGNKGTIKFSLTDTSMLETYNSNITKDYFRLDSMKTYSANFQSLGENKYNITKSVFINSARQTISFVNNSSTISFGITSNGNYYYYEYLLHK